ncbi:FUSC family protein [Brachybacterium sacelli]|uniref:FUSC family protein n=1 Tax=Brachybacterium sacelli TaxID=173364 RepID=UPI0036073AEA
MERKNTVRRFLRDLPALLRRPETVTDLLQIAKGVLAGTAAWALSIFVLDSQLPFLAPWTALLTVHATVHRSLSRGAQTTVASAVGVLVSFVIGAWLGVSVWTFALALLVGLLGSRISWIRDEGVAIATTAIFLLGSGFDSQQPLLLDRMIEVALGVAVGVGVNLLIIPPLRDQQAARYVDSINRRMGDVLINMADEFSTSWDTDQAEAWFRETESMSEELDSAWQTVRFARESERVNPRSGLRRRRGSGRNGSSTVPAEEASYENILARVDEGISHLRHLTRTLREATHLDGDWDARFRKGWVRIVRDAGHAMADPDAEVEPIFDRLSDLSVTVAREAQLPRESWPLYGSLITSMRHIAVIVDDVASAREAREGAAANPRDQ